MPRTSIELQKERSSTWGIYHRRRVTSHAEIPMYLVAIAVGIGIGNLSSLNRYMFPIPPVSYSINALARSKRRGLRSEGKRVANQLNAAEDQNVEVGQVCAGFLTLQEEQEQEEQSPEQLQEEQLLPGIVSARQSFWGRISRPLARESWWMLVLRLGLGIDVR